MLVFLSSLNKLGGPRLILWDLKVVAEEGHIQNIIWGVEGKFRRVISLVGEGERDGEDSKQKSC